MNSQVDLSSSCSEPRLHLSVLPCLAVGVCGGGMCFVARSSPTLSLLPPRHSQMGISYFFFSASPRTLKACCIGSLSLESTIRMQKRVRRVYVPICIGCVVCHSRSPFLLPLLIDLTSFHPSNLLSLSFILDDVLVFLFFLILCMYCSFSVSTSGCRVCTPRYYYFNSLFFKR